MQPFRQLNGIAVALRRDNVDTDQVIPARFLKISRAEGLGDKLFHDLRFDADGGRRTDFPLNDPARQGASILIGRKNFGVGSSREAAVYALVDHGFRCVVATSLVNSSSVPSSSLGTSGSGSSQPNSLASPWYWIWMWATVVPPSLTIRLSRNLKFSRSAIPNLRGIYSIRNRNDRVRSRRCQVRKVSF